MNIIKGTTPSLYLWNALYREGATTSNLIFPTVGSIVVDNRDTANVTILYVSSTDDEKMTFETLPIKATALAPDWSTDSISEDWDISSVDYGNNRFYMYYTEESANDNGGYKITIDKRISIPGNDIQDCQICRLDANGNYIPISMYFDGNGNYTGSRIPVVEVSSNLHIPTNCHTVHAMKDDDVFKLVVFDYSGTQTGEYKLFSKRAIVSNTAHADQMIIGFILDSTQRDSYGLYLLPGQDPDALVITPKLLYNDGRTVSLPIDGTMTQLYGLENFIASSPGQEADVLCKYYLHESDQAYGPFVNTVNEVRYLSVTDKIRVIDIPDAIGCKLSVVPRYYAINSKYVLTFFLYTLNDNTVRDVTHLISIDGFNGGDYTTNQEIVVSFDMSEVYPEITIPKDYNQYLKIRLAPTTTERYLLSSSPDDVYGVYGVEHISYPRPMLYYDALASSYYVPASKFPTVDQFLESFYYKARPLYESSLSLNPVLPTHFTLRNVTSNTTIVASPIALTDYGIKFAITSAISDSLVGNNVIVEFLKYVSPGVFTTLYGVPVDVYNSNHFD